MLDKMNLFFKKSMFWLLNLFGISIMSFVEVSAQGLGGETEEDFTWWYILLGILILCLAASIAWLMKSKKAEKEAETKKTKKLEAGKNIRQRNARQVDKEMEWLRKNPKLAEKNEIKRTSKNQSLTDNINSKALEPMEEFKADDAILPVFTLKRIELARPFAPLPLSNDEALMSAIEQTHDELEEDEDIRDLALRILSAFKTRNSVEALSQMALYDLSSNLRSKAVAILSEFNHETVFEPILQASADPTREVRAAAARALSKLTIDRADAWTRIFESGEEGRMRQASRAATESGIVEMSFDRLVHKDMKYSYEAVTLMALLIKAGETEEVFNALKIHKNMNVRKAILHVIKIVKDKKALDVLYSLLEDKKLPAEYREEIDKTIEEIGFVSA